MEIGAKCLAVTGATIIDGNGGPPIKNGIIAIDNGRVQAVGQSEITVHPSARRIDARGKYVIPGLMNANVHLSMGMMTLERLARHANQYEEVISEAAQVALRSGLTTVFDTCGLRRPLITVRDRINAGELVGSRIFSAGWIIGFDGFLSADFNAKAADVASASFVKKINAMCAENIGRHLMWLAPEQVAREVRAYIGKGIDFIKYASNEHFGASAGAFLQFSPRVQTIIVEEAHRACLTAQAHCMSVEGLHIAVEAGCDLVTHCNITGPTPIPQSTLELMAARGTGAVVFAWTEKGLEWIKNNVSDLSWTMWQSTDVNARNLIRSGAPLLLANDGTLLPPEWLSDPRHGKSWSSAPEGESLISLAAGHFYWFGAMEEKGCPPMNMLQAATKNIAVAYGKDKDLGTLEEGKIADLLILDKDPLQAAENYRSIHMIIKEGVVVDRDALPLNPILTQVAEPLSEEERAYIPSFGGVAGFPMFPTCSICSRE